ncbi:MAG: biotin--[acetyl-CoA-carboxylase] ligase [Erysipelotrichaceae bacterium]
MVKDKVLYVLERANHSYCSGTWIAQTLNLDRTQVWKAIHTLREEGYQIQGHPKLGYRMNKAEDRLSKASIQAYLKEQAFSYELMVYDEVTSTNDLAKQYCMEARKACIIANSQTKGRGRLDRTFYSPAKTGIYMSIILDDTLQMYAIPMVSAYTSLVVRRVVSRLFGIDLEIKWINDLYYQGKKVCGILCEADTNFETQAVRRLIVGIGLNLTTQDFAEELMHKAGCLVETTELVRNQVIAELLREFSTMMAKNSMEQLHEEYRHASMVIGKDVIVKQGYTQYHAHVLDIQEDGGLLVKDEAENLHHLTSAEISIIPKK